MTKILLVEDDKSLREIYGIRLAAEGYEIISAGDGEEALAAAVRERPELILSDVMMPKISGFDMLDILRATPETQNIRVIMMTALSSDEQRERGESLGADKYLVKSQVGIEDVINAVHEVLGDRGNAGVLEEAKVGGAAGGMAEIGSVVGDGSTGAGGVSGVAGAGGAENTGGGMIGKFNAGEGEASEFSMPTMEELMADAKKMEGAASVAPENNEMAGGGGAANIGTMQAEAGVGMNVGSGVEEGDAVAGEEVGGGAVSGAKMSGDAVGGGAVGGAKMGVDAVGGGAVAGADGDGFDMSSMSPVQPEIPGVVPGAANAELKQADDAEGEENAEKDSEVKKSETNVFANEDVEVEIGPVAKQEVSDPLEAARLRKMLDDEIAKMGAEGVVGVAGMGGGAGAGEGAGVGTATGANGVGGGVDTGDVSETNEVTGAGASGVGGASGAVGVAENLAGGGGGGANEGGGGDGASNDGAENQAK